MGSSAALKKGMPAYDRVAYAKRPSAFTSPNRTGRDAAVAVPPTKRAYLEFEKAIASPGLRSVDERRTIMYVPREDVIDRIVQSVNGPTLLQRMAAHVGGFALDRGDANRLGKEALRGALERFVQYMDQQGKGRQGWIIDGEDEALLVRAISTRLGKVRSEVRRRIADAVLRDFLNQLDKNRIAVRGRILSVHGGKLQLEPSDKSL